MLFLHMCCLIIASHLEVLPGVCSPLSVLVEGIALVLRVWTCDVNMSTELLKVQRIEPHSTASLIMERKTFLGTVPVMASIPHTHNKPAKSQKLTARGSCANLDDSQMRKDGLNGIHSTLCKSPHQHPVFRKLQLILFSFLVDAHFYRYNEMHMTIQT
jgi:hypothetical protein